MLHNFLEWRGVLALSNDPVGIKEVLDGVDFHTENQKTFKTGEGEEGRLIAKVFLFRAVYKGSAYAYAMDPLFSHLGKEKFWQGVIDSFYEKYSFIKRFHDDMILEVMKNGIYQSPLTGVIYQFEKRQKKGAWQYNESEICNYAVQGLGADIQTLVRKMVYDQLVEHRLLAKVKPLLTVHDSIMYDVPNDDSLIKLMDEIIGHAYKTVHLEWKKWYGFELSVPMGYETKIGDNWQKMKTISKG